MLLPPETAARVKFVRSLRKALDNVLIVSAGVTHHPEVSPDMPMTAEQIPMLNIQPFGFNPIVSNLMGVHREEAEPFASHKRPVLYTWMAVSYFGAMRYGFLPEERIRNVVGKVLRRNAEEVGEDSLRAAFLISAVFEQKGSPAVFARSGIVTSGGEGQAPEILLTRTYGVALSCDLGVDEVEVEEDAELLAATAAAPPASASVRLLTP